MAVFLMSAVSLRAWTSCLSSCSAALWPQLWRFPLPLSVTDLLIQEVDLLLHDLVPVLQRGNQGLLRASCFLSMSFWP